MKKQNDRYLILIYIFGISLILILRDLYHVNISKYIILAFALAVLAMGQYETVVKMLCFSFPLMCGLPGTYLLLGALLLLIFKRKRINLWQLGSLVFIILAEILASFWYPKMDIVAIVNYVSFAGVMFFLLHDSEELDYTACIQLYMYGTLLLFLVIIISTLRTAPGNWLAAFARGTFRFGQEHAEDLEGMALSLNANSLAYYSITAMACGIFLAEKRKGLWRLLNIALAVFSAVAGFLSVSRSWLLMSAICMLLYILSKLRSPKQFLTLGFVLVIVFAVGNIYLGQHPELTQGFIARLTDDTVETGGGRTDVFRRYIEVFLSDIRLFLFGAGVTQYRTALSQVTATHNGTQQVLVCYGIFGFLIFVGSLMRSVLRARKPSGKISFVHWLPLVAVILFVQTIQFVNPPMLMLPFTIGVYGIRAALRDGIPKDQTGNAQI